MFMKCPSCFVRWTDSREPLDVRWESTCQFCADGPTQREALEWQMQQLENISDEDLRKVLRHMFFYLIQNLETT